MPSSRNNPQSNEIIERIHLVMLNILRTLELGDVIWEYEDYIWKYAYLKSHGKLGPYLILYLNSYLENLFQSRYDFTNSVLYKLGTNMQ